MKTKDPDSFTYDGYSFGRFPAGVDLVVGVSRSDRASMVVGQHWSTVTSAARAFGVLRVAPGQSVVNSACEQSGRAVVPEVLPLLTLDAWLDRDCTGRRLATFEPIKDRSG